jgi:alpha-mannosidase
VYHSIRFTSGKIQRRLSLIEPLAYRRRRPLVPFRYLKLESPSVAPPVSSAADDGNWQLIPWGSHWCEPLADFALRTHFQIPSDWSMDSPVALHLPIGEAGDFSHPEALAYIDGLPYAACDRHHQEIILAPSHLDGASHLLALHGWAGSLGDDPDARLLMRECALVQIDQPTRDFIALARVVLGIADHLDGNEPARAHLYGALDEAFKVLDTREPFDGRFYGSVPAATQVLREGVSRAGPPLDVRITAAGQAHIDVAWLWTLDQTRRKAGRTFYNVMRLMEQFPEYCYSQSQPQLYEFVRQDDPELFELIQRCVRDSRWEPLGGMWVEADCNITGGESLARQFLLGREFFRQHFGPDADAPVLWLPDVFGFSWSLPQLLREAGLRYFFTIKIGWSEFNRLPYDSFWWQGLDGTRVLTHFSPTPSGSAFASTFNARATPEEVLGTWRNLQQKDWGRPGTTPPLLMSFGYGDGGGGPTREMLENIREMGEFPATPQIRCGTVGGFFQQLEAEVGDRLPTWNGELYLEYHRGTYTTQSRTKRANRKSEFLLHDAEFLAALATVLDPDYAYPQTYLRRAWELVCLNQFHDIIPGSSIGPVYVESQQQYAEVRRIGEQVREGALAAISAQLGGDVWVVNPTSFPRRDLAFWASPDVANIPLQRSDGSLMPVQPVDGGLLLDVGEVPPYSVTPLILAPRSDDSSRSGPGSAAKETTEVVTTKAVLRATPTLLENDCLRIELDSAGDIVRIHDKANGREVLPASAIANQVQAFEDRPRYPDAWDIDIYYDDKLWLAEPADSVRVVESGPLRATLEVQRRVLSSEYVQRISLAHNSPRLDFDTTIQWRERHILLKVAFPVDVLSPQATYEIQWGNIQRPTHRNTSWDWARFEVAAQKWVDLSEGGYGVSLLNDCKYGHDVRDNVIRLSLLRSPTNPDPDADKGEHQFAYSLLPHAGGWDDRTVAEAYALNDPLIVWANRGRRTKDEGRGTASEAFFSRASSFVKVDAPNVVIETIKQAEDGQGLIVRLYESQRRRGEFTLTTSFPLAQAWRTNLLEENQERLEVNGRQLRIYARPYQILTLRLVPKRNP